MKIEDIEKTLRAAKFHHLTEAMLVSYRDQKLDKILQTRVAAHLKLCLICESRLLFLKEEYAAPTTAGGFKT